MFECKHLKFKNQGQASLVLQLYKVANLRPAFFGSQNWLELLFLPIQLCTVLAEHKIPRDGALVIRVKGFSYSSR